MASFPVSLQLFLAGHYIAAAWFAGADHPGHPRGYRLYCRTRGIVVFDRTLAQHAPTLSGEVELKPVPAEPSLPPNEEFSEFER